ncbi:MAG TPA: ABC transporter ATP-binding protein [Anaerolineae bacterium]|nr:ABC transporter ATP-binding protein [Anaerolineae bacterium]
MRQRLEIYQRLLSYLTPYRYQLIIAYVSMIFAALLNLFIPQIIKDAIDNGLASGRADALFSAGALILAIALGRGIVSFGQRYYGEWLSHRVSYDLRNNFYHSVQYLPFAFHDRAHTGDLMSRATSDISETERFVGIGLMDLLSTLILMLGVLVAMFFESQSLTLIALGPILILAFYTTRFGSIVRPMFKKIQEQMGVLSSVMQESMTGIRVVKAFAREPHELHKFDEQNDEWFQRRFRLIKAWADNWPFFTFLVNLSIALVLWFGAPQVLDGQITVGALFALISYLLMLAPPVQRLGFLINLAATASAAATRVFHIIDTPREDQETATTPLTLNHNNTLNGNVTFDNVSFAYTADRNIITDINFTAPAGHTIALIGPTGSGKSTLTNLIPRFYNPTAGRILVDGQDIHQHSIHSLRQHIGIVLQEPFLFSATIAQNIAYGRPNASLNDIVAAAKAARAHKFITQMPDGYDTRIGERGVTLSGGQKQRVAIARALLADPRILILDDSTSSVDTETEYLIQQALNVLMEGRTTFVIAQRLLTLKNADTILVLDQGHIVERGTHDQLLTTNGLYRQIYDLQLRDQETFMAQQNQIPS